MRLAKSFVFILCATLLTAAAFLAAPAQAQRAIEGATPHPSVPLPPAGYVTAEQFTDFAVLDFPASPETADAEPEILSVEGAHTRMEYTIDGYETATLRLYRTYLQYFEAQGFEIVFHGMDDELSHRNAGNYVRAADLARQPARGSEIAYILARSADGTQVVALTIHDRQRNRRLAVHVVDIEDMETLDLLGAAPEPVVEVAPEPEPEPEPVALPAQDAAELESGLVADGRVVVNAILFEFDRAEILPESAEALATVASLMQDRAGLSLLVVGHTDGVGSFDYNLRLSVERATAVVDWLRTRHGIAADRLRPAGAGPMSPITTNRTEAGRALNRRVELVEVIE